MNEWARQVLQAETDRQIAHAQRKASGLQFGDFETVLQIMAETTADDDHGGQYIVEVLAELVLQCKAAGYSHSDFIAIGDSPQALADSNAHGRALESVLIEESKARQQAEAEARRAETRAKEAEAKAADYESRIEYAMSYIEDFCSNPDTGKTECDTKEAAEKALDLIYWHMHL